MTTMDTPVRPAMSEYCACDTDELNSLLRGELAAIETYQQAIPKFDDWNTATKLGQIRDEHAFAASVLRARVINYGGTPSNRSGVWGAFAAIVAGTAKILGPQTVIASLREGEELGHAAYERALDNANVSIECKYVIRGELMRRCQEHITILGRLMDQQAHPASG